MKCSGKSKQLANGPMVPGWWMGDVSATCIRDSSAILAGMSNTPFVWQLAPSHSPLAFNSLDST